MDRGVMPMADMGHLRSEKHIATTISGGGRGGGGNSTTAAVVSVADHRQSCCSLRRLIRKLKKQSKMLCAATRPTTFHCHYDPLSYARNFDGSGYEGTFKDDSDHFYTFSSRFAAPSSVLATTGTH